MFTNDRMMAVLLWGAIGVGLMVALLFDRALAGALAHVRAGEQRYRHMFEKNPAIKLLIDPTSGAIIEAARARWRDPRRRVDPGARGGVRVGHRVRRRSASAAAGLSCGATA